MEVGATPKEAFREGHSAVARSPRAREGGVTGTVLKHRRRGVLAAQVVSLMRASGISRNQRTS